ncbi:hypothetical protein [Novosphingobium panipatense]|uniref:hypothetical protein n=1 Tax=Novosphingobium panipatense TaxID=428991 RepID=UPI003605E4B3
MTNTFPVQPYLLQGALEKGRRIRRFPASRRSAGLVPAQAVPLVGIESPQGLEQAPGRAY